MKVLIVSDIHGSSTAVDSLIQISQVENVDLIVALGDFLYNGPRNPVNNDYDPLYVSKKLNTLKNKIVAVCGNCDSKVDKSMLEFDLPDTNEIYFYGRKINLLHGDMDIKDNIIFNKGDMVLSGHTHVPSIKKIDDVWYANPGSLSMPKGEVKVPTYIIMTKDDIRLYTIEQRLLELKDIK